MRSIGRKTADPAPSRWGYRYQRMMLTPWLVRVLTRALPLAVIVGGLGIWLSNDTRRDDIAVVLADMRERFETRPEFMVEYMVIEGAEEALSAEIREVLPVEFPVSSFDLDLQDMRSVVSALNRVESAALRVRPGGVLEVEVAERVPAALWRHHDGLRLVDSDGRFIAAAETRYDHPRLPLIAGDGAKDRVPEALALYEAAGPLSGRVRGLVRMGERRWDMILDNEQRLLLPEVGAAEALERIVALDQAKELLLRDVARVDMRNPARPTVQLNPMAVDGLRQIHGIVFEEDE